MTDCPKKRWRGKRREKFGRPVKDQPRNAGLKSKEGGNKRLGDLKSGPESPTVQVPVKGDEGREIFERSLKDL